MADDQLLTSWNIGDFMNKLKIISTQLNTTKREEGGDVKINSNVKNIVGKKMKDISKILLQSGAEAEVPAVNNDENWAQPPVHATGEPEIQESAAEPSCA